MYERGLRRLSTNHICGEGYWVWLIPLASGPISIGIVADPRFHPWEGMNTLDGASTGSASTSRSSRESIDGPARPDQGLPQASRTSPTAASRRSRARPLGLVGEAGAFLDPFYSPGSDFIAMANTFTTDLVTRELDGEDVTERAKAHDDLYRSVYRIHLTFYEGQYEFWHNPLVMNVKIGAQQHLLLGRARPAVLPPQAHRPRVHGRCAPGPRADLGAQPPARGDVPRVERARGSRVEPRDGAHVRPSRRCSTGTSTWSAGFDDETLKAKIAANADLMEAYAVLAFNPRPRRTWVTPRRGSTRRSTRTPSAWTRPVGVRRAPQRRGPLGRGGAPDPGGRDGEPLHGGDRTAGVTPVPGTTRSAAPGGEAPRRGGRMSCLAKPPGGFANLLTLRGRCRTVGAGES